jgi:Na+/proline symporter
MSSSLFFGYPQLAVIPQAGILGLAAYCFATVAPLWAFGFLGPYIRKLCPDGFTLAEYIRRRFGWPLGVLSALIVSVLEQITSRRQILTPFFLLQFVGFMLCFMIVELNTYGSVVSLLGGVNPTVAALIVALTTTIYTTYGGFKASLWTDNVNGIIVIILIIVGSIAVGVNIDIQHDRVEASGLLKPQRLGGELWYILTVAILFSQMFNQGEHGIRS